MELRDEFNKLNVEKEKIFAQEKYLREKRKAEIAYLAERTGVLGLPNEEIQTAFQKLVQNRFRD